ncbi:MAG TPA: Ig-like domain-containing protein [Polyangia bacterium]|nr:Ig-like domain-containing protein [Polyangia bacterium]
MQPQKVPEQRNPTVHQPIHYDLSQAFIKLHPSEIKADDPSEHEEPGPNMRILSRFSTPVDDPVVQRFAEALAPSPTRSFDGIGQGFVGPGGTFTVQAAPPDTNGDVGPNHFVQTVNISLAVFRKDGTVVFGPVPINTLWSGFGGRCETNNDGDPVVQYDPLADRWVISQFVVTNGGAIGGPFFQCVAVSTTPDPSGTYNRYAFQFTNFIDYPKMGVWSDAYYFSFNDFDPGGGGLIGPEVCAMDKAKMIAGQSATDQCFSLGSGFASALPADLDGTRPPPAGSPNYIVELGTTTLNFWKFHVDFATPANSTLTGPQSLPIAAYTPACSSRDCIPQPGSTQRVDGLADRLMYRFAYRNFGSSESLVVNHTVQASPGVAGVRWYELRNPGTTPIVFQQGTFAPDNTNRFMGSAAMDQVGNLAIGYDVSSSTVNPGIRFAGRLANDPAGLLSQGESTLIAGTGVQNGVNRYGDYSSINVDPTDDCTFWFTSQYMAAGSNAWHTRIGTFKFDLCTGTVDTTPPSTNITAPPNGATVSGTTTISANATDNVGVTRVEFQVDGVLIAMKTAPPFSTSWDTTGVANGAHTLTTRAFDAAGNVGTSAPVMVTVNNMMVMNDFSLALSPTAPSVARGGSTTFTVTSAVTSGAAQPIALSLVALPAGITGSFNPANITAGASSTLTINVANTAALGTANFTVRGTGPTATHSVPASVVVTNATTNDFSIAISPASRTLAPGGSTTYSVTTAVTSGVAQMIALDVSGLPTGITGSFAPASISAGASATLTLTVAAATPPGATTFTVTGTGSGATHSTTASVIVTGATPGIVNGGFETGNLNGWTVATGQVTVVPTNPHGGSFAAQIGSQSPLNGDSTLTQTIAVPATGTTQLSFFYNPSCPDTLQFDQQQAQIRSTAGAVLATLLNVCSNSGAWTQVTADLTPFRGQSIVLWFNDHDDGFQGDPTFYLLDDVTVTNNPAQQMITNGGFEGSLSGWTLGGVKLPIDSVLHPHTGVNSLRLGATTGNGLPEPNGDSTAFQAVAIPADASSATLSFFFFALSNDVLANDFQDAQVQSADGSTTLVTIFHMADNSRTWTQRTVDLSAFRGQTVRIFFNCHGNGATNPTTLWIDDVSLRVQ